ncbi:ATP-binding protein, partial [Pseudonocardia nigra]|uniref:ATP-binding protein n=1 Tax=Pseudonocardia nigra TaxID=1921578 RepID=UPI001C5E0183
MPEPDGAELALVGRRPALDALRRAVDDAIAGHGRQVLLTGDAGIGKTALATATTGYAARLGASVAWGTCWEGQGAPAFWPWLQVVRDLAPSAEAGNDSMMFEQVLGLPTPAFGTGLDDRGARFRIFDAVARLLRHRSASRPVVAVLDDLQWADVSSVRLLAFVVRHVRDARLLLVGAYRDVEVEAPHHPLRELLSAVAQHSEVVPLTGLGVTAVGELMGRVVDRQLPEAVVAEVHARTGGNPFFVQQVTRLLAARPAPLGGARTGPAPSAVRDVVARRLAHLPAPAVGMLAAGGVVGTRFDIATAAAVVGIDLADAVQHLDAALRARIVTSPDPATARFEHDLFREVLYEQLPALDRSRLHLAIAEQLEARRIAGRPVPPPEVAHHRAAALPLGDPAVAVAALLDAAKDATRRAAFDEAVGFHRQAISVAGTPPVTDPAALVEFADALRRAGNLDEARATFLTAAARARGAGDLDRLAQAAVGAHRVTTATDASHREVIALLEEAVAAIAPGSPGDRCRLLAALARELCDGPARDEPRALALVNEAVREARARGDPSVLAHALWALADVRWHPGTARERLAVAAELAGVAEAAGERELALEGHFCRLVALVELADPTYASALDRFALLADELRVPRYRYLALSRRATRACLTGSGAEAEELIEAAAAYGEQVGEPDAWGVKASQLVGLAVLRGDWSRISAAAEALGRPLVPAEFAPIVQAFLLRERGEAAAGAPV